MKREDLRSIEGMTDGILDAVMALAGKDATAAQQQRDALQAQLTTAQTGLAAFGTQKPGDLAEALQRANSLQQQLDEQARLFRFRDYARNAAQDAGAIDVGDVIAALERDEALKGSTNLQTDIEAAVDRLKSKKPHWFSNTDPKDREPKPGVIVVPKPGQPSGQAGSDMKLQDFLALDYMRRLELKAKNPALFKQLMEEMQGKMY